MIFLHAEGRKRPGNRSSEMERRKWAEKREYGRIMSGLGRSEEQSEGANFHVNSDVEDEIEYV